MTEISLGQVFVCLIMLLNVKKGVASQRAGVFIFVWLPILRKFSYVKLFLIRVVVFTTGFVSVCDDFGEKDGFLLRMSCERLSVDSEYFFATLNDDDDWKEK